MHHGDLRSAHQILTGMIHRGDPGAPPLVLSCVDPAARVLRVGIDPAAALPRRDAEAWVREQVGDVPVWVRPLTFHRHANKQALTRPLLGGVQITCPAAAGVGSIGVVVQRPSGGERGFVTAGHTVGAVNNVVYQPRQSTVNNWQVGVARVVSAYGGQALSDSAFVGLDPIPVDLPPIGYIWKSGTARYQVANVLPPALYGVPVMMQGASSATAERSGDIVSVGATVRFSDGGVLTGQIIAAYVSHAGDSGGPVYIPMSDNVNVHLLGINVGSSQSADINPAPPLGTYGVCSPWASIVSELGAMDVLAAQAPRVTQDTPPARDSIVKLGI
ncbi:MAG TPA: hypothetical protein VFJ16_00075 [Longimicrobium sp.]|nr:hypothetical protein [Longimicrobium sp.]